MYDKFKTDYFGFLLPIVLLFGGRGTISNTPLTGCIGCFNLCSDVQKVKNFIIICSPRSFDHFDNFGNLVNQIKGSGGAYEFFDFWHITT